MSNITTSKPSYVFGYWRPWDEDSKMIDSYLDYTRDTSLIKYGADTLGKYINQASKEQVQAITHLGKTIGRGMDVLSSQMLDINDSLAFLNRNLDIQIEQQKLTNLLLQNIAELLRVPDSEKERQYSIELGVKFFVNASKDADLYSDSLEEFLKAESLMKQDYFVLHRIGCIYLYVEKYINPEKALDYFIRAAKYASVESDINAVRLANVLTNNFKVGNSELNNSEKRIGLLAADSYEKAAFSAYILGRFTDAEVNQKKAILLNPTSSNKFLFAKYAIRNGNIGEGIHYLNEAIDSNPEYETGIFKDLDLLNNVSVLELVRKKNVELNVKIDILIDVWRNIYSEDSARVITDLTNAKNEIYESKILKFNQYYLSSEEKKLLIDSTCFEIDDLLANVNKNVYCNLDGDFINDLTKELFNSKGYPIEKMVDVYRNIKKQLDTYKLQIGSSFAGGIVFFLDDKKSLGLVCLDRDLEPSVWGAESNLKATKNGLADGSGMYNSKNILKGSWHRESISTSWFTRKEILKPAQTASRRCLELNHIEFSDWYLPTESELRLLFKNLKDFNILKLGFKRNEVYWSSCERNDGYNEAYYYATGVNSSSGRASFYSRNSKFLVRPIRVFYF